MPGKRQVIRYANPNHFPQYHQVPAVMTRNQPVVVVANNPNHAAPPMNRKASERAIREAYRKEKKMDSYLAEDENYPSFANQLAKQGLQLRDIPGDGNCLFRALGDQLEGHGRNHFKHRIEVTDYMMTERNDFEPFVEDDVPFEIHVHNLRKLGTYAGNDAIVAFARLHQVNVMIHQLGSKPLSIQGSKNSTNKQLHIAYHNGDHYSSIRKVGDNTESAANIQIRDIEGGCDITNGYHMSTNNYSMATAIRSIEDIEYEVMKASGCNDIQQVQEMLMDCDYDSDMAIAALLQIMDLNNGSEEKEKVSPQTSSGSSGIWSENGSATRIFGGTAKNKHLRDNSIGGSSGYGSISSDRSHASSGAIPKQRLQNLSAKQRKEIKKMEKKQRAEDRHRSKILAQQNPRVVHHEGPEMFVVNGTGNVTRI